MHFFNLCITKVIAKNMYVTTDINLNIQKKIVIIILCMLRDLKKLFCYKSSSIENLLIFYNII